MLNLNKQIFYVLLGIMIIWGTQGCGPAFFGPTPIPTPDLPAAEIANRASEAMLATDTLHYAITLSGRLAYIDRPPTTALKSVEGDLLRPDKVTALVKVSTLGIVTEIGLISIDGLSYVTNPLNQRWEVLPPEWGWYFDPSLPFDDEYGIPAVVPQVELEKTGIVDLDGKAYYHLKGITQGEIITWWTAGLIGSGDVPLELWIDTETFLIHKVHLVELSSDPERPTEWEITFSDFNQPLDIQAPPGLKSN